MTDFFKIAMIVLLGGMLHLGSAIASQGASATDLASESITSTAV